jgi:DNA polymerase elongation subunit (family B)
VYRNCVYEPKQKRVQLFTWDENGERVRKQIPFYPYLYLEDPKGSHTSIYGTKLRRKVFPTSYDRNKFLKESGIRRLFENIPPAQQFLIDNYWETHEDEEFLQHPLKIWFLDIEIEIQGRFTTPEECDVPINIISLYDTIEKKIYSYGLRPYTGANTDIVYTYCKTEEDLFMKFIEHVERDYPDVLSGWNSDFFDIPYIINRGEKIVGERISRLSPLGVRRTRTFMSNIGKEQTKHHLDGVSLIDYLDVYKKFTMVNRASYKLDSIADVELGSRKLDYGGMSLEELYKQDWNKFVDYNVHDVQLLVDLEEKLKYISLLRMLSSTGLTTSEAAMGTLSVVTGALCCQARGNGEIIATFDRGWSAGQNPGAYVAEPIRGFSDYITSFDANSLYPNIMITLNASPETKVATMVPNGDMISVRHVSGKTYEMTKQKFIQWMKAENLALSKAGVLFSQKKKGILPDFVDRYYNLRVGVRKELQAKKERLAAIKGDKSKQAEINELTVVTSNLHIKQHTIKILINSAYGYTGNKRAALGDDDIASSITLTGQAVIKQSNDILRRFTKNELSDVSEKELDNFVVYNDTDSVYITLAPFINRGIPFFNNEDEVNDKVYDLTDKIEEKLNEDIMIWGGKALNSNDCRLVFKRESICDVGMFLQKKRYVLHVRDDEGIKVNKFKYKGVEVVRTTMPTPIKPYAKKIIETMLMTKSLESTTKVLNETYEIFCTLPEEEIAFVMGVNKYEQYAATCDGFTMGLRIPHHVKSAHYFNTVLDTLKLDVKYEKLQSGDKVRFLYINKNNRYGIDRIGFKYDYPEEFKEYFEIDYNKMFEKIMFQSIERFYQACKWGVRKPWDAVNTELSDIFG